MRPDTHERGMFHGPKHLELIGTVKLRQVLELEDGSEVDIELEGDDAWWATAIEPKRNTSHLQIRLDAPLERLIGLASDQRFSEYSVAIDNMRDGTGNIRLDIQTGNPRSEIEAAFYERHVRKILEFGLLFSRFVRDGDHHDAVLSIAFLETR